MSILSMDEYELAASTTQNRDGGCLVLSEIPSGPDSLSRRERSSVDASGGVGFHERAARLETADSRIVLSICTRDVETH